MEAQSYTAQERRAANQVWAAAGEYGFEPLFLARNTDGTVDFYMNCIVGLVHKYYGDDLVRGLFNTWDGDVKQSLLDDLTWLYLESAAYALETLANYGERHGRLSHRGSHIGRRRYKRTLIRHHDVEARARSVLRGRSGRRDRLAWRLQLPVGVGVGTCSRVCGCTAPLSPRNRIRLS